MTLLARFNGNRIVQLTDLQNAFVTTAAVLIGLVFALQTSMSAATGFLVVATQNVAGLNVKGSLSFRVKSCLASYSILCTTAMLVVLTGHSLTMSLMGLFLLCLSLAYWHRLFPGYWASINIPTVVIFFMAMSIPNVSPVVPVFIGASFGLFIQCLVLIFLLSRYNNFPEMKEGDMPVTHISSEGNNLFLLHMESLLYGIQALILLSIALIVLRISGFPHAYWMAFTIIIVLKINHQDTKKYTLERMLGTIIGCVLGSILLLFHPKGIVYIGLIGMNIFLFTYLASRRYVIAVIFISIFVLLLIGHQSDDPVRIAVERTGFTLAGGALTYIASLVTSYILKIHRI